MVVSLDYILPFWFSNDGIENREAKSISGWCIAENLGRQLNTDWKFTECCSTHLRFIWKQAPTVSGTNMSVGGQPGETSSWTVPPPLLHVLSPGLRTSKSKGKKEEYFQYYCSGEPTSFCVTSSEESEVFINNRVTIPIEPCILYKCTASERSQHSLETRLATAPAIIGCWLLSEGGLCVTSHYDAKSPHRWQCQVDTVSLV